MYRIRESSTFKTLKNNFVNEKSFKNNQDVTRVDRSTNLGKFEEKIEEVFNSLNLIIYIKLDIKTEKVF